MFVGISLVGKHRGARSNAPVRAAFVRLSADAELEPRVAPAASLADLFAGAAVLAPHTQQELLTDAPTGMHNLSFVRDGADSLYRDPEGYFHAFYQVERPPDEMPTFQIEHAKTNNGVNFTRVDTLGSLFESGSALFFSYTDPATGRTLGRPGEDKDTGDKWYGVNTKDDAGLGGQFMRYGPYTDAFHSGSRTATFELKVDNTTADNAPIVTVDVYDFTAGTALAQRTITRSQFVAPGKYQPFQLDFTATPGHKLEFRTLWHGTAAVDQDDVTVAPWLPPGHGLSHVAFPSVWKDGGTWYLTAEVGYNPGLNEPLAALWESPDGMAWVPSIQVPLNHNIIWQPTPGTFYEDNVSTPLIMKENGQWSLFFTAIDDDGSNQTPNVFTIGLAQGTSLHNLQIANGGLPVMRTFGPSPGATSMLGQDPNTALFAGTVGRRSIIKEGGAYYMAYEVTSPMVENPTPVPPYYDKYPWAFSRSNASVSIARSVDLVNWTPIGGQVLQSSWQHDGYTYSDAQAKGITVGGVNYFPDLLNFQYPEWFRDPTTNELYLTYRYYEPGSVPTYQALTDINTRSKTVRVKLETQTAPQAVTIESESGQFLSQDGIGRVDGDWFSVNAEKYPSEGGDKGLGGRYMRYGPYTAAFTGSRTATFKLKVDNAETHDSPVVTIDVHDATVDTVLAQRTITRREFARAGGDGQLFDLDFYSYAGHVLQFRTYWHGYSSVRQDDVTVTGNTVGSPGRADFAVVNGANGLGLWSVEASGQGLRSYQDRSQFALGGATFKFLSGDMDGDGWDDFVSVNAPPGGTTVGWGWRRNVNGVPTGPHTFVYTQHPGGVGPDWHYVLGDFNGDGRDDFAAVHAPVTPPGQPTVWASWYLAMNNVPANGAILTWEAPFLVGNGTENQHTHFLAGDVNGDGYDDFLTVYDSGATSVRATWYWAATDGNTHRPGSQPPQWFEFGSRSTTPATGRFGVADMNGDGYDDFLFVFVGGAEAEWNWAPNSKTAPNYDANLGVYFQRYGATASGGQFVFGDFI